MLPRSSVSQISRPPLPSTRARNSLIVHSSGGVQLPNAWSRLSLLARLLLGSLPRPRGPRHDELHVDSPRPPDSRPLDQACRSRPSAVEGRGRAWPPLPGGGGAAALADQAVVSRRRGRARSRNPLPGSRRSGSRRDPGAMSWPATITFAVNDGVFPSPARKNVPRNTAVSATCDAGLHRVGRAPERACWRVPCRCASGLLDQSGSRRAVPDRRTRCSGSRHRRAQTFLRCRRLRHRPWRRHPRGRRGCRQHRMRSRNATSWLTRLTRRARGRASQRRNRPRRRE